jgi:hypothetical protein
MTRGPSLFVWIVCFASAGAASASTRCVNQGGTDGCYGTIGAALTAAADGDTILIAAAANPYFEHLTIAKNVSLMGANPATTIVDGSLSGQVIRITTPVTVTLSNLTIRNGRSGAYDYPDLSQFGGGIHKDAGTLTLTNCIVSGNATGGGNDCCSPYGGGIANLSGTLTINGGAVTGNATAKPLNSVSTHGGIAGEGGGIYNDGGATLILNHATVSGNVTGDGSNGTTYGGSAGWGGGIAGFGTITLNESTVSGNQTGIGGTGSFLNGDSGLGAGISCSCILTVESSTVSGNATGLGLAASTGGQGGGVHLSGGSGAISNSTVAFNQCDPGQFSGGIDVYSGAMTLKNSLFAFNRTSASVNALQDCAGTVTSLGYNVMMEPDCTISATTGDDFYVRGAILGPLKDNGGPTRSHSLASDSPALESADNSTCLTMDQRGVKRPLGQRCDVGAFENEPIGDANGDGVVDVADVFYVVNFLFAGGPVPRGRANVNADSGVDVADVFYTINFLFAGGPAPH